MRKTSPQRALKTHPWYLIPALQKMFFGQRVVCPFVEQSTLAEGEHGRSVLSRALIVDHSFPIVVWEAMIDDRAVSYAVMRGGGNL